MRHRVRAAEPDPARLQRPSPQRTEAPEHGSSSHPTGNRAVSHSIQTKLTVGPAGDRHEREADKVAAEVVKSISGSTPAAGQRQPEEEELMMARVQRQEDEELLQGKRLQRQLEEEELMAQHVQRAPIVGLEGGALDSSTEAMINTARSGGSRLNPALQRDMEGAFGADFSQVRVHTGAQADELNESLQARAFTSGNDVFVRSGDYQPDTTAGRELLAHELTHVVQQGGG